MLIRALKVCAFAVVQKETRFAGFTEFQRLN